MLAGLTVPVCEVTTMAPRTPRAISTTKIPIAVQPRTTPALAIPRPGSPVWRICRSALWPRMTAGMAVNPTKISRRPQTSDATASELALVGWTG